MKQVSIEFWFKSFTGLTVIILVLCFPLFLLTVYLNLSMVIAPLFGLLIAVARDVIYIKYFRDKED